MARSKSPRGKSPARKKASKGAANFMASDDFKNLVHLGLVVGMATFFQGGFMPTDINNLFSGNGPVLPFAPFLGGLGLFLHILNNANNAADGFWASSYAGTVVSTFAPVVVADFVNGRGFSLLNNESTLALVFVVWYVVNRNIPFVNVNLYSVVTDPLSQFVDLNRLLALFSLAYTTNCTIDAAAGASGGSGSILKFNFITACAAGVLAGCAGNFFPAGSGGIKDNEDFHRAMDISFWTATNGFATVPVLGALVQPILSQVTAPFGGNRGFILFTTLFVPVIDDYVPITDTWGNFKSQLFNDILGL